MQLPHEVRALRYELPHQRAREREERVRLARAAAQANGRRTPDPEIGVELLWLAYYLERASMLYAAPERGEWLPSGEVELVWIMRSLEKAATIYGTRERWRTKRRSLQTVRSVLGEIRGLAAADFLGTPKPRHGRSEHVLRAVLCEVRREVLADFVELCGLEHLDKEALAKSPLARVPAAKPAPKAPEEREVMLQDRSYMGTGNGDATKESGGGFLGRVRRTGATAWQYAKKPLVWGGAVAVIVIGGVVYFVVRGGEDGGGAVEQDEQEGGLDAIIADVDREIAS